MERTLGLVTSLLLAASVPAQQSVLDEARKALLSTLTPKLASEDPVEVAWAAHTASRYRVIAAGGAMADALRWWQDVEGEEARQVRLHLLDALWSAEVKMPAADLKPLLDDRLTRVAAFLLIARDVKGNAALLAQLAQTRLGYWDEVPIAAGGLLVDEGVRVPALATHLLGLAQTRLSVEVIDDTEPEGPLWNSAVGLGGGASSYRACRGFPRMPIHKLAAQDPAAAERGPRIRAGLPADSVVRGKDDQGTWQTVLPAEGKRRMDPCVLHSRELKRSVHATDVTLGEPRSSPDSRVAVVWLERMALHALPGGVHMKVQWKDAGTLEQLVEARCAGLQTMAEGLVPQLIARDWLPEGAHGDFRWPVEVSLWDHRGNTAEPLPDLEETRR